MKAKVSKKGRCAQGTSTDTIMANLWLCLRSDLSSACGCDLALNMSEAVKYGLKTGDYSSVREHEIPGGMPFLTDSYFYKCSTQLFDFFKRYRFDKDLYTDSELENMTNAKFLEIQLSVGSAHEWSYSTRLVISRARSIVRRILGVYSPEEHGASCRFGKRASLGHPASDSYLDSKLVDGFITGHVKQLEWFTNHLAEDNLLQQVICEGGIPYAKPSDRLLQTNVPKSFKIHRGIMPNTLVGSYYTYGLGRMLESRLKDEGLDIRKLPRTHGEYARKASRRGHLVTADLSNASHSFSSAVVNALVPRDWYNALKLGRITSFGFSSDKTSSLGGETCTYGLNSFMAMGIGFTFTLQTLLYYAIIRAIQDLSGRPGMASVYGDDLIYPVRIHKFVTHVLTDLGFTMNADKTYSRSFFRESCGQDFHRGVDVRPFRYEGVHQRLSGSKLLGLLYQLSNGLLRRWSASELPKTMYYMQREIASRSKVLYVVPPHFPDYSGLKVMVSDTWDSPRRLLPWSIPRMDRQGYLHVTHLSMLHQRRVVLCETAYYWDRLRAAVQGEGVDFEQCWRFWEVLVLIDKAPAFQLVPREHQPKNYRSKLTRKRLKLSDLTVPASKGRTRLVCKTSIVSTCTEDIGW